MSGRSWIYRRPPTRGGLRDICGYIGVMETQYKSICRPVEVKEAREDGVLTIRGYALAFGNVDSWGDIIAPNACDEFLASENADRLKFCNQHNMQEVVGVITAKGIDETGMWFEADVLPTTLGKDLQILLRAGALNEFSIGYWADRYHYEKVDGYKGEVRVLDAITIIEVSPVTRAANPRAVITDMKAEEIVENETPAEDNEITPNKEILMDEMKNQLKTIEQKAAAAEKKAADLAAALEAKETELKTAQENINNLDASVKSQENAIADLRKMITEQPKTFRKAMREALDGVKGEIETFIKDGKGSYVMEFKVASPDGAAFGSVADNNVHALPILGNAFLLAFRNVNVNGNKLAWIEATASKNVGYVAELAASSKTDVTFVEKTRAMAKVATYMEISSDVEAWYEMLYDFCVAEGQRIILKDIDAKVWAGAGADGTKPKEIYGIKGAATAFSALGTYTNPNAGDVLLDSIAQVQKAGFRADVAIVSYKTLASLKGVKDTTGNYLYNQLTGMFGQVQVFPSDQLSDTEMLVADSYCAEIAFAPLYELEFSRQASTDSWRVDLRRHVQVKVPTPKKGGIVYTSAIATAITAIKAS